MKKRIFNFKIFNVIIAMLLMLTSFTMPLIANGETVQEMPKDESVEVVNTDEIIDVTDTESIETPSVEAEVEMSGVDLFSTASDQHLTVDIPGYTAAGGMNVNQVYDVVIKVDFTDATSINKKLIIDLPVGLQYTTYPVDVIQIPKIETKAPGVLGAFINNVIRPTKQLGDLSNYSGKLVYEFVPGTAAVEVPLKVQVDQGTYWKDGTIAGDLIINASKGSTNTSLGEVTFAQVKTIGAVATRLDLEGSALSQNVLIDQEYQTNSYTIMKTISGLMKLNVAKKFTVYFYYPKELTYVKSNQDENVVEVNTTAGYVKFETQNLPVYLTLAAKNITAGTYTASRPSYIEVEQYTGEIITISEKANQFVTTHVKDPNAIPNRLAGRMQKHGFYYDYGSNYSSPGPYFQLSNNSGKDIQNQWYEVTIDPNYVADYVDIPDIANKQQVFYRTNVDPTLKQVPGSAIGRAINGSKHNSISTAKLGLADGEYITMVKAYLGTVPNQYYSYKKVELDRSDMALGVAGRLKPGATVAPIIVKTYEAPNETALPLNGTELILTSQVKRTAKPIVSFYRQVPNTIITAGERKTINTKVFTHRFVHETQVMVDPVLYIKLLDGMTISNPVAKIDGVSVPTQLVSEYTTPQGQRFAKIAITGTVGAYVDNKIKDLLLSFDIDMNIKSESESVYWSDILFLKDDVNNYGGYWDNPKVVQDVYDVDCDGDTTETLLPMGAASGRLIVNANKNLLIDTYIYPEGESRRPIYDSSTEASKIATATGFTPGTTGIYVVDILNNVDEVAKDINIHIPIPKEGNNYGTAFQEQKFLWNMKLMGAPVLVVEDEYGNDITAQKGTNYKLTYAADATNEANYPGASYGATYNPNATMIKVTNTLGMNQGERAYLTFKYVVDESNATISATPEKLGAINDFRPFYSFKTSKFAGSLSGTAVGARLDIGVISGIVFKDVDYNGVYDKTIDQVLSNKTVTLYKKAANGSYQQVDSTTTTASGSYTFENLSNGVYYVDFNAALGSGQEFSKKNVGTDITIDSDVEVSGAQKGKKLDIDPTVSSAKYISAGIINYELPTIDIDKSTTTIKTVNEQQLNTSELLTTTITPDYFAKIQKGSTRWSSSDQDVVTVTNDGYVQGIVPGAAIVTVFIEDIYGNTATDTINVTVVDNNIPVITGDDTLNIKLGDTFIAREDSGLSIQDVEDGMILATDTTKVVITGEVPVDAGNRTTTVGAYLLKYVVTDTDGNTAEQTILVNVTQDGSKPIVNGQVQLSAGDFSVKIDDVATVEGITESGAVGTEVIRDAIGSLITINPLIVTVDTTELTAIQTATEVGVYPLTFTTTNGTDTARKTIVVTITNDGSTPIVNGQVQIAASDFSVKLDDVATVEGITEAGAIGTEVIKDTTGNVTAINPLNVTVDATELTAIQTATQVGAYPLTFTTTNGTDTASKTIVVTITNDGSNPIVNGQVQIAASDFSVKLDDVATVSGILEAGAIGTEVIKDTTGNVTVINPLTVIVDTTELTAIQTATQVGAYPLTFTTTNGIDTVSKTIVVTITNDGSKPLVNGQVQIAASDFSVKLDDVATVSGVLEAGAIGTEVIKDTTGNITAINPLTVTVDPTELTAIQTATQVGAYSLTFSTTNGTDTVSKTIVVTITNDGSNPIVNGQVQIAASDFSVKLDDVATVSGILEAGAIGTEVIKDTTGNVTAINPLTVTVDATELTTIQTTIEVGAYPLTFTTTNGTDTVSKTIVVTITNDGSNPIVNGQVQIAASDFSVKLDDVATVEGITESGAVGTEVIKDTTGNVTAINPLTVTVDPTELTAIHTETQVGVYPLTFTTTNGTDTASKTIVVTITNDGSKPIVNGQVQIAASDFSVEILDAATVNGIAEAGAFANQIVKVNGTVTGINPLTVVVDTDELSAITATIDPGVFPLTFTATDGVDTVTTTIQVTVVVPGPYAETIVANNFTTTLDEVATADFITLAGALAQDVTNPLHPVNIPVTEVSNRPTTAGFHTVRFETTTGGFIEVEVLVTNETAINNEVVVAHDFTIDLKDLDTADFIALADAQGYDITNVTAPVEIPVIEVSSRPDTIGTYPVRFETANSGYAIVEVTIEYAGTIVLQANNFELTLEEFNQIAVADLEQKILELSDAKVVDTTLNTTTTAGLSVSTNDVAGATQVGVYHAQIQYTLDTTSVMRNMPDSNIYTKDITITLITTDTTLPNTGEYSLEIIILAMVIIIMSATLIISYQRFQKK